MAECTRRHVHAAGTAQKGAVFPSCNTEIVKASPGPPQHIYTSAAMCCCSLLNAAQHCLAVLQQALESVKSARQAPKHTLLHTLSALQCCTVLTAALLCSTPSGCSAPQEALESVKASPPSPKTHIFAHPVCRALLYTAYCCSAPHCLAVLRCRRRWSLSRPARQAPNHAYVHTLFAVRCYTLLTAALLCTSGCAARVCQGELSKPQNTHIFAYPICCALFDVTLSAPYCLLHCRRR